MPSIEGKLLIASPFLEDENFFRSVIYMVRHDSQGAFGLVLNRETTHRIDTIFDDVLQMTTSRHEPLFLGGPVAGPMIALHDHIGMGDPVPDGDGDAATWMTADEDHLRVLARDASCRVRFFIGYSGWGSGQLESELEVGGWIVCPAPEDIAFVDHENVWKLSLEHAGRDVLTVAVPHAESADPLLN